MATAPKSLKEANQATLVTILVVNAALFWATVKGESLISGDWIAIAASWSKGLIGSLVALFAGVLNAQLTADMKARLVFWRWDDPLPGCRAFSVYLLRDPRIDKASLERRYAPLPTKPHEQNTLWYRLYRTVQNEPAVLQAHKLFLFARDYACLAWMMVAVYGTVSWFFGPSPVMASVYVGFLIVQYGLSLIAARNSGVRLVTSVLAIISTN